MVMATGYWVLGGLLALGMMPQKIKLAIYDLVSESCLSRFFTLGLVMTGAVAVAMGRNDLAVGLTLFAVNLVRRNGGKGSVGYVTIVIVMAIAVWVVAMASGLSLQECWNGVIGATAGLMFLQLVLALTNTFSEAERIDRGRQAFALLVGLGLLSGVSRNAEEMGYVVMVAGLVCVVAYMVCVGCKVDSRKQAKRPTLDYVSGDYLSNVINR